MDDWQYNGAADRHLTPVERWRAYQRESGLISSVARGCWWSSIRMWLRVWHRLEIEGSEHCPRVPSFVLVANHSSHLDTMVLGAAIGLRMRNCLYPLAAGDVFFEAPAMAAFSAGVLNALPIWRKRDSGGRAIKDLRQRLLDQPTIFVLFPEGTRSRDGRMGSFKPGIGMLVAGTPCPVIPCHIDGAFRALPPRGRIPRPAKMRIRMGAPRCFGDVKNRRAGWEEVARVLEQDVRSLGGVPPSQADSVEGPDPAEGVLNS